MDINSQYLILAAQEALINSKIQTDSLKENIGVFIGTLTAGIPFQEKYYKGFLSNKHYSKCITQGYFSSATNNMASYFNIIGPRYTITTACSASLHAIGLGAEYVKHGKVDKAIVGGVDAFCGVTWGGFYSLKSLSEEEIRPFSKDRSGLLIGEGSGVLILESLDSAIKRGAHIYGEIQGWGTSGDAYHITAPNPTGETQALAMKNALKNAQISDKDVNYVGAHGTGTKLNDMMETRAIKLVFGDRAKLIPISSIKSMIGHTMGAAGVHLVLATLGMIRDKKVYPTINYLTKDFECDLDYTPNFSRNIDINNALINSFGFGGNNASLVVSRYLNS